MLSKTSSTTRFWHYVALIAFMAVAQVGCGGGGGGTGGGSPAPTVDTTPPHFAGLQKAELNQTTGNVEVTAAEATDSETPVGELTYLIYVSDQPTVDKSTVPPQTFTGAGSCTGGQCRFALTGLKTDGTTTYHFASNAKDSAGHLDADAHPNEGALTATPLVVTVQPGPGGGGGGGGGGTGGVIASSSLNVNPGLHAVHPALALAGDQRYVTWEECIPAPSLTTTGGTTTSTPGWDNNHPCSQDTPAQVYVRKGANWDLVSDPNPALGGRTDLTRNSAAHGHNPTLTYDGTNLFAAWKERGTPTSNLFVMKFDGSAWSDTQFPDTDSDDRPALTRHPILGTNLGMAFERSPGSTAQLFFQQFTGSAWQSIIGPLNKNNALTAEAPIFSKKGDQLYVTWKEQTTAGATPNILVKRWNNTTSAWENLDAAGTPLNINAANEARFPSVDLLGNVPYVAWHECTDSGCNQEHIFVKHWDGSQWIQDKDTGACGTDASCGSLNSHSTFAKTPYLAVHNDKVYVAWSERDALTNKFAVHIKRLEGDKWVEISLPTGLFVNNAHSPMLFSNGALHIAWVEANENDILQLIVAKLG